MTPSSTTTSGRGGAKPPRLSPAFAALAAALEREGAVDVPDARPRGFGAQALRVGGRIFAMPVEGALVLKLPASRVDALVESGVGRRYDPGRGRLMREWVVVADPAADWLTLAREARTFVDAAGTRRR